MLEATIHEVSPRDGLQNEASVLPTATKAELIGRLVAAGVRDVEVTSFVRPRWIPQLSDASELCALLPRGTGARFWGLVPNAVGLERALEAGLRHVATFLSASETHNKKNLNRTVRESLAALEEIIPVARDEQVEVRAYISTVFGCPYEGEVPVDSTLRLATRLLEAGAGVIALGDTTGMGNPRQVEQVLEALFAAGIGPDRLAVHLHDTRGAALANGLTALRMGVRNVDASVAGLGGCPYAPGASGNLATEDLVHALEGMGVATGIDLAALAEVGCWLEEQLGRELPGRYHLYWRGSAGRRRAQSAS
jgi:hydroxymethylglutaryl-CoA lyase